MTTTTTATAIDPLHIAADALADALSVPVKVLEPGQVPGVTTEPVLTVRQVEPPVHKRTEGFSTVRLSITSINPVGDGIDYLRQVPSPTWQQPLLGGHGSVLSIKPGQRSRHLSMGAVHTSMRAEVRTATTAPLLVGEPHAYRWKALSRALEGEIGGARMSEVQHSVTVRDGQMECTYRGSAYITRQVPSVQGVQATVAAVMESHVGRLIPGIGYVHAASAGQAGSCNITHDGMPTSRDVVRVPVELSARATVSD
ncbi:hypothetical protein IM660_06840 [Ruania alkalisoli]|uniref:Uncharacterized protein n=1 Tax=Ruania alkalisoli TaxID=2779775 RepID=A0A7M1SWL7_9MICO|nr:hypothetical protein [Ruania alkalisoli]QOR71958.1 hypothetical protein IM660_06840 [Ruania alkalisoli]